MVVFYLRKTISKSCDSNQSDSYYQCRPTACITTTDIQPTCKCLCRDTE